MSLSFCRSRCSSNACTRCFTYQQPQRWKWQMFLFCQGRLVVLQQADAAYSQVLSMSNMGSVTANSLFFATSLVTLRDFAGKRCCWTAGTWHGKYGPRRKLTGRRCQKMQERDEILFRSDLGHVQTSCEQSCAWTWFVSLCLGVWVLSVCVCVGLSISFSTEEKYGLCVVCACVYMYVQVCDWVSESLSVCT